MKSFSNLPLLNKLYLVLWPLSLFICTLEQDPDFYNTYNKYTQIAVSDKVYFPSPAVCRGDYVTPPIIRRTLTHLTGARGGWPKAFEFSFSLMVPWSLLQTKAPVLSVFAFFCCCCWRAAIHPVWLCWAFSPFPLLLKTRSPGSQPQELLSRLDVPSFHCTTRWQLSRLCFPLTHVTFMNKRLNPLCVFVRWNLNVEK